MSSDPVRVVLYGRAGCHLCDEGREVLRAIGEPWAEVDVDEAGGQVLGDYGDLVPVVEVDGVRQGYWRIDADRVRKALAKAPREP